MGNTSYTCLYQCVHIFTCFSLGWSVVWVISQCFSYPLQHVQIHIFVLFQWYASTIGNLDFHKRSLVHGWLSKTIFSRASKTMSWRGWSQFIDHSESIAGTKICVPITQHVGGLLLGFLVYCVGPHSSHKDAFVHGWTPNCSCFGGCGGERQKQRPSYSAMLLTSLYAWYSYLCIGSYLVYENSEKFAGVF